MILRIDLQRLIDLGIVTVEGESQKPQDQAPRRAAPKKLSYVVRAVDIWEKRMGAGSGGNMFGRVGRALKPLVERYGEDEVLGAFEGYMVGSPDATFLSPEAFSTRYSIWAGQKALADGPKLVRHEDEIEEVLRRQGERGAA